MPRNFDPTNVNDTIAAFCTQAATFTSGHVTVAVRNAGLRAGTFGHWRVARAVRNAWDDRDTDSLFDGYTRTMVYIGSRQVFAYHPDGDDPSSVDLDTSDVWVPRVDINSITDATADLTAPRATTALSTLKTARELYNGGKDAVVGDTFRIAYNGDGYAQVPRSVTRLLGLMPGDAVMLTGVTMSGQCRLRKALAGEAPRARLQPTNGQLRLRDSDLMVYGVGNGDHLEVEVAANELTLS